VEIPEAPAKQPTAFDLRLVPGLRVAGRVTLVPGSETQLSDVQLSFVSQPTLPTLSTFTAPVQSTGQFSLALPSGEYRINASIVHGATGRPVLVESVATAGRRRAIDTLDIRSAEPVLDALIEISTQRQGISGSLLDASDRPATHLTILVFPEDRALRLPGLRRVRMARPATDGHFSFPSIPAGQYRLVVLDNPDLGQVTALGSPNDLEQAAMRVVLAPGSPAVLDLRVAR
jgi:hypothetical protein